MPAKKDIELRSGEVQEILASVPVWMVRWGITLIFGLVLLLVFISWFIKYPDLIEKKALLSIENPPFELKSQTEGNLKWIYIQDQANVKKGQDLAKITNGTSKDIIDDLKHLLDEFQLENAGESLALLKKIVSLGAAQEELNSLLSSIEEYIQLTDGTDFETSLNYLISQIQNNRALAQTTADEMILLDLEVVIAKDQYRSDSILYQTKKISKTEFHQKQDRYLTKRQEVIQSKKLNITANIAVANFVKQKSELEKAQKDKINDVKINMSHAISILKEYCETWQQTYTVTSPSAGTASFCTSLNPQANIKENELLITIIPNNQIYFVNVHISSKELGKVKKGQKVRIELDKYPAQEHGYLTGQVDVISQTPSKKGYSIRIKLANQLTTDRNKVLSCTPNMLGTATIITKDQRLSDRIFNLF